MDPADRSRAAAVILEPPDERSDIGPLQVLQQLAAESGDHVGGEVPGVVPMRGRLQLPLLLIEPRLEVVADAGTGGVRGAPAQRPLGMARASFASSAVRCPASER